MRIEIHGIPDDRALQRTIAGRMTELLEPLRIKPVATEVSFFDENGPKGGIAIRCALMVRVPYRPTVRVERVAETHRVAFDDGVATLKRQLTRYRELDRDRRRRPKKYYAAKRLLRSGLEREEKEKGSV